MAHPVSLSFSVLSQKTSIWEIAGSSAWHTKSQFRILLLELITNVEILNQVNVQVFLWYEDDVDVDGDDDHHHHHGDNESNYYECPDDENNNKRLNDDTCDILPEDEEKEPIVLLQHVGEDLIQSSPVKTVEFCDVEFPSAEDNLLTPQSECIATKETIAQSQITSKVIPETYNSEDLHSTLAKKTFQRSWVWLGQSEHLTNCLPS